MKRVILALVFAVCLLPSWSKPGKKTADLNSSNMLFGVWKYEQVFHNDPMYNGIAKKEYILKLNQDGSYVQTVQVTPVDPLFYAGPLVYQLQGTWTLKDNMLYIVENGKDYTMELNSLKDKFVYFDGDMPTANNSDNNDGQ